MTYVFHISDYNNTFNVQPQPIRLLEEPKDHVALAGADVTFVCSTTVLMSNDISSPHITWLYNNSIIESSSSTMEVKNVTSNDQGVYHCMVDEWRIKIRSRCDHLNGKYTVYVHSYVYVTGFEKNQLPCTIINI